MPLYPDFETEGAVIAKYILTTRPDAKIGVLYQNDDFGKDYVKGLRAGLGTKASQIVAEVSYELSDPTIDSQIVQLKAAGVEQRHLIIKRTHYSSEILSHKGKVRQVRRRLV